MPGDQDRKTGVVAGVREEVRKLVEPRFDSVDTKLREMEADLKKISGKLDKLDKLDTLDDIATNTGSSAKDDRGVRELLEVIVRRLDGGQDPS